MSHTLYSITDKHGRIYYGQTNDVAKRWKQHYDKKDGVVRELLNTGYCKFEELEYFDTKEEARLTEALLIELFPCVNKRSELVSVAIPQEEYGQNYRKYHNETFNKKGKCPYCNKVMIDRNIPRHTATNRCKFNI